MNILKDSDAVVLIIFDNNGDSNYSNAGKCVQQNVLKNCNTYI